MQGVMFGYFTVAVMATAAVSLASGVQFLVIGLRQRCEPMYLAFAVLCLCIATLAFSSAWGNVSQTMTQSVIALRVLCGAAVLSLPALVIFVDSYSRKPVNRYVFGIVSGVALWFFWFNLQSPYSMLHSSLYRAAPIVLPWGESLFTLEGTPSAWRAEFYWFTYAIFAWTLFRAGKQYLEGQRLRGALLGACLLLQFLALLWGAVIVKALGKPYPALDAFAFLSFVLLMGVSLSSQLRAHTLRLEQTTKELRTEAETRREAELSLHHAAYHDALTGLPNRLRALHALSDLLLDATRSNQHGAVLMIDLDNFKTINDSLGHHVGDRVLEAIADSLLVGAPTASTVARLGGDEFVVLLGALATDADTAAARAMQVAESLLKRLATPLAIGSRLLGIGASIGVAIFPNQDGRADDIIRCADIALYRAKSAGRNAARLFLPHMQHAADDRLALERGLRVALERQEFSLRFQPQLSPCGKLMGTEALLRWQHPTLGDVAPTLFIPIAEETGLIHALGSWVISQVCTHIREWQQLGVDFGGRISVNVSPWQIAHPQFVQHIEAQVAAADVIPSWLTLELTESALLNDFDAALNTLHRLSAIGFRLALDDFGTGYSSLAYLQRLPLDELKIDQAFISVLQPSEADPLAGFIIDIGRRLGLITIAEGVETGQQKTMLETLGCDALQGYFICQPLTATDFVEWLTAHPMTGRTNAPERLVEPLILPVVRALS